MHTCVFWTFRVQHAYVCRKKFRSKLHEVLSSPGFHILLLLYECQHWIISVAGMTRVTLNCKHFTAQTLNSA